MNKWVVSAAVAASLAGSAFTYNAIAAPDPADAPSAHRMAERGFMLDAKLAGMKAALQLTPEQEKLWPAFEAAVREGVKARREAMQSRDEEMDGQRPSPIAMMTRMSDRLAKASDQIKKIADAATPLYNSLDDSQKGHFGPLCICCERAAGHAAAGAESMARWGRSRSETP